TFSIPLAQLTVARTLFGIVTNPAPGGGSASFSVNVLNVKPTVIGFTPGTVDAGTNSLTIQVTGANFVPGSQVTFGGTPVPTTFGSTAQLTATITSSFLTHAGSVTIGATNPAPGGGATSGSNLTINSPKPSLSPITP